MNIFELCDDILETIKDHIATKQIEIRRKIKKLRELHKSDCIDRFINRDLDWGPRNTEPLYQLRYIRENGTMFGGDYVRPFNNNLTLFSNALYKDDLGVKEFKETPLTMSRPPINMLLQEDMAYITINMASSQNHHHQQRAYKNQNRQNRHKRINTNRHNRRKHSIHQPGRTNCSQRFQH